MDDTKEVHKHGFVGSLTERERCFLGKENTTNASWKDAYFG